jgi:2,4-dienoyl-CoA reductase-like NADH-dependent reductase (Old Yellow Enzyme family)
MIAAPQPAYRRVVDALEPAQLGPLTLRNRILKAATYEGMSPGGRPSAALVEHHRALARGGVGLTTVAYAAVASEGRTFPDQLLLVPEHRDGLRRLTDAVHEAQGRVAIQLGHAGFFSKLRGPDGPPRGPSWTLNRYGLASGLPLAPPMAPRHIAEVLDQFAAAADEAVAAGFDAIELHMGHGYLLSQFLSPATNRRRDAWGGDEARRRALPLAVARRVREVVGPGVAVLAKVNLHDGFAGGVDPDSCARLIAALGPAGVDAAVLSGGFTSRTPFFLLRGGRPLREMIAVERNPVQRLALRWLGGAIIREHPFEELFFLELARRVRAATSVPLVLLGGVVGRDGLVRARAEGFEFVAMGRALLADPDLVVRMARGEASRTRCTACNRCVAEMDDGGVRCWLDGPRPVAGARLTALHAPR